jgi:GT2 family glycosyltransferase
MTIEAVRNSIVEQALSSGCTHILLLDTDQSFLPSTITKLLKHDLPVVGGLVHRRYPPFDPLLYRGEPGKYLSVPDEEILDNELVEVSATGTGCILYKTECFLKTEAPWFEFSIGEDGKPIGEDIGFCIKLKKAGYRIFVDTTLGIGHIGSLSVDWNTYKLYQNLMKNNN